MTKDVKIMTLDAMREIRRSFEVESSYCQGRVTTCSYKKVAVASNKPNAATLKTI